jgi:peroxiredoxin
MKRHVLAAICGLLVLTGCTSNAQTGGIEGGSFVFVSPGGKAEFSYPASERQTIGDFTGPSVTDANTTIKLSNYPDTVMVLNFWGSWCAPCRAEAQDLNVAAELSVDREVQFLGINVQDTRQSAADFMTGKQVSFPSIFDPTMRTILSMQGYPTTGIPSTIVLDRDHRVAHIFIGRVDAQQLDQVVAGVAVEGIAAAAANSTSAVTSNSTS